MTETDYYGSPDQQATGRKAEALWRLLRQDDCFGTHGRSVGVRGDAEDALALHLALTRLLGVSACDHLPIDRAEEHIRACDEEGLKTDRFEVWESTAQSLDLARSIVEQRPLPQAVSVTHVDRHTPAEDLRALSRMMADSGGVLLPNSRVMRGIDAKSVCLFARDGEGRPVASSAAVAMFHPSTPVGGAAWWGMLSTAEHRRGEGLALTMGSLSMLAMNRGHGFTRFFTGIREGNDASERLCAKLGLVRQPLCVVIAIDPTAFGAGRLTK